MRLLRSLSVVIVVTLSFAISARAQQAASTPVASGTQTATLGNATVPLTGPWKFHIGDSPQVNGASAPAWAQPGFDDSTWGTMDLTPPPGSYDPIYGSSGYVSGWTARGYKGYHGYAWYRLRVNIHAGQTALALKMPNNFDDAYQVYVNGNLIGQFGRFTRHGIISYNSMPHAFPLPANIHSGSATLAIRMWMDASTSLIDPDAGGLHGPPVLGQAAVVASLLHLDWNVVDQLNYSSFVEMAILLLALLVSFALFRLDRSEPVYLWLGLVCAVLLAYAVIVISGRYWPGWWGTSSAFVLTDAILVPLSIGLWVIFWAHWFRLGDMTRIHRIVWSLVVLLGIGVAPLRAPLYGTVVPVHAIVWLSPLTIALKLLLGVVLAWVTVRGIRKNRLEGWLALLPVALVIVGQYQEELITLHVPVNYFPLGISVTLNQIAIILSLIIITVLLVRRFLHGQRQREQMKLEIEQARQIQQVLIPSAEALPIIPGFTLESEYRPTQSVGGDFFQIIRHPSDGSLLIVLGDVTGHGLRAAMTVSLLVGAIRTEAAHGNDPMTLLNSLNQRLHGRGKVYATCIALRIQPDGATTLANAGHLPPFLNGKELDVEGSIPLGLVPDAQFTQMNFRLNEGDRLLLMTDGVAEARDKEGELFGFDRVATLVRNPIAAADVASAAQAYGQQDDITVIRIARDPVATPTSTSTPVA